MDGIGSDIRVWQKLGRLPGDEHLHWRSSLAGERCGRSRTVAGRVNLKSTSGPNLAGGVHRNALIDARVRRHGRGDR